MNNADIFRFLERDIRADETGRAADKEKHSSLTAIALSGDDDEECLRIIVDTLQANCTDFMLNIY
ncbi:hypothetical protein LQW54_004237 [Pestalotiopsis sp. IQ-011]